MDDADPDHEEHERPRDEAELDGEQRRLAGALVRPTPSERISAVEGDAHREQDDERKCERYEGEADDLPFAAEAPEAPEEPCAEVEPEPEQKYPTAP